MLKTCLSLVLLASGLHAGIILDFTWSADSNLAGIPQSLTVNMDDYEFEPVPFVKGGVPGIAGSFWSPVTDTPNIMEFYPDSIWMSGIEDHALTVWEFEFPAGSRFEVGDSVPFTGAIMGLGNGLPYEHISGQLSITDPVPTPEPSPMILMSTGAALLFVFRRRRR